MIMCKVQTFQFCRWWIEDAMSRQSFAFNRASTTMSSIAWQKITVKFNALIVQKQIKDIYAGTLIMKICMWHISEFGAWLFNISEHWWHVCKHYTPIEARSKSKSTASSYVFSAIFKCATKCVTRIFQV